jgi:hypothetical protein
MTTNDSEIMNYLVRMVVPMRREFGKKLDVVQFLHDMSYATDMLKLAHTSQDPRLKEYAQYVQERHHGARVADSAPADKTTDASSSKKSAKPAPSASTKTTEEELRAKVSKKYTSGLR